MGKINSVPNEPRFSAFYDEFTVVTGNVLFSELNTSQRYLGVSYQTPSAINDETTVKFNLAPGSYTLFILGATNASYGTTTVSIDGISQGTIDWYSASITFNVIKTIGITINSNAIHSLNLKVATKNASSSGYSQIFTKIWIK